MIQKHDGQGLDGPRDTDNFASQHENLIGWVNPSEPVAHSLESDSSGDYMIMTVRHTRCTEPKIAEDHLPVRINKKAVYCEKRAGLQYSISTSDKKKTNHRSIKFEV